MSRPTTYMTEARLQGLVALCNKHGADFDLRSTGKKHVVLRGEEPATPPVKAGMAALFLNGFLASIDAKTKRRRR